MVPFDVATINFVTPHAPGGVLSRGTIYYRGKDIVAH